MTPLGMRGEVHDTVALVAVTLATWISWGEVSGAVEPPESPDIPHTAQSRRERAREREARVNMETSLLLLDRGATRAGYMGQELATWTSYTSGVQQMAVQEVNAL